MTTKTEQSQLPELGKNTWSINKHILTNLRRPRPGDKKPPTRWPSAGTAVSTNEDGEEVVHGRCRRAAYFKILCDEYDFRSDVYDDQKEFVEHLKAAEIPPNDRIRFIWAQGELYEDYVIKQSKASGIFVFEQVQVYVPEWNISGRVDIVVLDPITNKLRRVEVKSVYGFGADKVIGKSNSRGITPGVPKDPNIIQSAIYDWWGPSTDRDAYGPTILKYGARDTGKFGEYNIFVEKEAGSGDNVIWIAQTVPFQLDWVRMPFTIDSILESYEFVDSSLATRTIPKRDFDLQYDREKLTKLWKKGKLNKTNTTQFEKVMARDQENAERESAGLNPKKAISLPRTGDFNCSYCPWKAVCYDATGKPKEL